ncbi:MAG: hypothetical protein ACP5N1_00750 [Candidatus Woesearchaeota archaeon]
MEFEQYLERDILAFLDSKMQHKNGPNIDREEEYGLYLTKDYLKELNYALDNDELTKAKRLFDELKLNYSKLPRKSIERKKIYALLEKMYEKIQDYVKIKEGRIEIIREGGSEIFKDKTDVFKDITPKKDPTELIFENFGNNEPEPKKSELIIVTNGKVSDELKSIAENSLKQDKQNVKEDKISFNSTKSAIKDNHKGKYYDEKSEASEDPNIITQSIFIKNGKNNIKSKEKSAVIEINNKNDADIKFDSPDIKYLENELIESTIHLEQIKTKIIEKLVSNLYQKVDEKSREQDIKIATIKKDMIESIILELDTRFKEEKKESSRNIEKLKGEILNQAYRQAKNIVADRDIEYSKKDTIKESVHNITSPNTINVFSTNKPEFIDTPKIELNIPDISPKAHHTTIINNNSQNITNDDNNMLNKSKNTVTNDIKTYDKYEKNSNVKEDKKDLEQQSTHLTTIINKEDIKKMYDEAIYYMNNNDHYKAFEIFKELLKNNPKNKAIKIRLHECIEKYPELKNSVNIATDTKTEDKKEEILNKNNTYEKSDENNNKIINNESIVFENTKKSHHNIDKKEESNNKKDNNDIPSIKLISNSKHREGNKEIHQLYEEAIYTMFQNNYNEAAKIFEHILNIRPDNKAARIRLQECLEVLSNA